MQQQHQQRMPLAAHEQQHADEACLTDSGAVDIETALNHVSLVCRLQLHACELNTCVVDKRVKQSSWQSYHSPNSL